MRSTTAPKHTPLDAVHLAVATCASLLFAALYPDYCQPQQLGRAPSRRVDVATYSACRGGGSSQGSRRLLLPRLASSERRLGNRTLNRNEQIFNV
jgi:hypothetical protein